MLRPARECGLSLLELLTAVGMLGIALSAAMAFASTQVRLLHQNHRRLEVRHVIRASGDAIMRDLRLAALCLPRTGRFPSLDGVDNGTADTITIRTGFARADGSCVASAANQSHTPDAAAIAVSRPEGFDRARIGYLQHVDGTGEFFTIVDVDPVTSTITRGEPARREVPAGAWVFAVHERTYALDTVVDPTQLTLEIDRDGRIPFAAGIEAFNVRYVLDRDCPPCDEVDLPVDDTEWRLVQEIAVTLTANTINPTRPEDYYSETRMVAGPARTLRP
jgi:type II secretory pathway pseudopilin PulG